MEWFLCGVIVLVNVVSIVVIRSMGRDIDRMLDESVLDQPWTVTDEGGE